MVEGGVGPGRDRVARLAGLREVAGDVGRCTEIVRLVTTHAVRRKRREHTRSVAISTDASTVSAGQRELIVIEVRVAPRADRMTGFALEGITTREVPGRVLIIARVAGNAVGRNALEGSRDVTLFARQAVMAAGQREEPMIERRIAPSVSRMTAFTFLGKVAGNVRWSRQIVGLVAKDTIRRQSLKATTGVALGAGRVGVASGQGETAVVEARR